MIIVHGTSDAVDIGIHFSMPAVDVYIRFADIVKLWSLEILLETT